MWQMAGPGSQRIGTGSLATWPVFKVHLVQGCGAKNGVLIKMKVIGGGAPTSSRLYVPLPATPASPEAQIFL